MDIEILKLYDKRTKALSILKEVYDRKKEEVIKQFSIDNIALLNDIVDLTEHLAHDREVIKDLALQEYKENNVKKIADGNLGIRVLKSLEYDKDEAFNWAKEHKMCLSLDKSSFEKIAKIDNIDFVIILEKPSVTFKANMEFK